MLRRRVLVPALVALLASCDRGTGSASGSGSATATATASATAAGSATATATGSASSPAYARISILDASMSAGFGGTPFAEAFLAAAPGATVDDQANIAMFQDAPAIGREQVDATLPTTPQLVVALDFLFWYAYNGADDERAARVDAGLRELDRLRAAGVRVVVGDVPRIVTAPRLIPPESVPSEAEMTAINSRIRAWGQAAGKDALVVPFASWAEPLAAGAEVELPDGGGRTTAGSLVAPDGLHANPRGVWYVLRKLDVAMEVAGFAAPSALVFTPPPAEPAAPAP